MAGILNGIKGLFNGGKVVEAIGNVVDNIHTSSEEKEKLKIELTKVVNDHHAAIEKEVTARLELELKDNADARNREVQIATSDKAPMLNKIITPILALSIIGLTFGMWWAVLFRNFDNSNKDVVLFVLGSLSTLSAGVVSYYFGSSAGSKAKQEIIERMK